MKRIKIFLLIGLLSLLGVQGLTAQEEGGFGFFINPSAYAIAGSEDYVRGLAIALDLRLDLFGIITPGVQAIIEYDGYFNTASVPLMFTLGWEDFYLAIGQTVNLTDISLGGIPWKYSGFPNTFGLGASGTLIELGGRSALKLGGELTYTSGGPAETIEGDAGSLVNFVGVLASLKLYVGVTLQLGL